MHVKTGSGAEDNRVILTRLFCGAFYFNEWILGLSRGTDNEGNCQFSRQLYFIFAVAFQCQQ